jgi:hypothetical protein
MKTREEMRSDLITLREIRAVVSKELKRVTGSGEPDWPPENDGPIASYLRNFDRIISKEQEILDALGVKDSTELCALYRSHRKPPTMASKLEDPPGPAHAKNGNCWVNARKCKLCGVDNLCDVCHKHDMPRGDCDECVECPACNQEDANDGK